ncbi:MAG: hypothetical protein IJM25_08435 [Eubacterium sp.]|nr:hypothetical protein [Eubacterium sp.]
MRERSAFDTALAGFVNDFASGDAVRHMADQGMTVTQIYGKLSFPTKKEAVAEMVWKHYLNTGRVRLAPPEGETLQKVTYVRDEGEFGRTSLRRVVEETPAPAEGYVHCNFGRELYRDETAFRKKLELLSETDREYILDLPWPLQDVWHILDGRMQRIREILGEENSTGVPDAPGR